MAHKGKTTTKAPSNVVPLRPRGGHGRPDQPWQYGNPQAGALDFADQLHWTGYAAPYLIGWLIVPIFGVLVRLLFGFSEAGLWVGVLLMGSVGTALAYATWDEARPRKPWVRRRAAWTVGWVFLAVVITLVISHAGMYDWLGRDAWWSLNPRWLGAEMLIGTLFAIWWTIGALPAVKGDGRDAHAGGQDALAEALGIGQTHPRGETTVDDEGIRKTIPLRLKGATIDALRGSTGLIAVSARAPRSGVRVIENPADASAPDLVILTKDVLADMPAPPAPSRPGGSVQEPVRVALHEDMTPCEATRVVAGFGGDHLLVNGKTGSGKTTGWQEERFELMTRVDVVLLHADVRKLAATFPDIAPAFARVATNVAQARKLCLGIMGAVEYRAERVGRCWTPESRDEYGNRMPAIGISMEEAGAYADALGEDLRSVLETIRMAGFFLDMSMQRSSGKQLDTDTRAQFGGGWCFPVMRDEDAAMCLNEDTILGGATPEVWGPKLPKYAGYNYRECDDDAKHSMPGRTWWRKPEQLAKHTAYWAPRMAWGAGPEGLDRGTATAMGDAWTTLTSGLAYALDHGWAMEDGLLIPPRYLGQTEKKLTPVTQPPYGTPDPVVHVTATVQDIPVTQPGHEDDEGLTQEEQMETEAELAAVSGELEEEMAEDDEIREHEDVSDDMPADWSPEDFPVAETEIELEPGTPGPELNFRQRVLAAADVIDGVTGGERRKTVRTSVLVEAWFEVPGITDSQRPALNRLLTKLVANGEAEDAGRGRWTLEPTAGGWLRRHAEELEAGDAAEEEEDGE